MSQPSPYQLEQAISVLLAVRQRLLEEDPDIAQDEKLFADMLEGEGGNAMDVLHQILRAAQHAEDMKVAACKRADEIYDRATRFDRRKDALRAAAFAAMDAIGLKKLELPELTASIVAGRPSVIITDMHALPKDMMRARAPLPDMGAISSALNDGREVPGATISNSLPYLQVRTK